MATAAFARVGGRLPFTAMKLRVDARWF